jgi:amidase/6-aminohexanoate-cyclic-dimer hydrolase
MANASDGGGSIRIPASCCGLVGLKPTRARTPMGPDRGEGWAGQSISHCVSKSVRDSAALLDATSGFSPGDPYAPTEPSGTFLSAAGKDPGKLKIALHLPTDTVKIDEDVLSSIKKTAELCESLGHHVEEASPKPDIAALSEAIGVIISANVSLALQQRADALGTDVTPDVVENITYRMYENGKAFTADQYAKATLINHQAGRVLGNFMEDYDLILSPVLAKPPVKIGEIDMSSKDVATYIERLSSYSSFTGLYNQTGQPSISLPLGFSKDDLPIGSMLTAKFGDDELLVSISSQIEKAAPWTDKKPPVYSS